MPLERLFPDLCQISTLKGFIAILLRHADPPPR
jgi:hypothetical protein